MASNKQAPFMPTATMRLHCQKFYLDFSKL
jgi:hypothetical protein